MAIEPNMNPESAALLGGAWISYDEDAFRADAERERERAAGAGDGASAVSNAASGAADTLKGDAGNALQDRLGEDTAALGTQSDRHAEAAGHLDAAAISIAEAKEAMNLVDADYHGRAAELAVRATAEGWTPAETALAKNDLLSQAQGLIANIQQGFTGAYDGVINALTATSGGAAGPQLAPGTVEVPGSPGSQAQAMGQAAGTAAVDFTAGLLNGVTGNTGAAGAAAGMNPMAGGMNPMMGAGMNPMMGGMNPMAAMGGYGMGGAYGGMPMAGMGGMGAPAQTPLNQIGSAVGQIAQGLLSGQQAGASGQAGVGGQVSVGGQGSIAGQISAGAQGAVNGIMQQPGAAQAANAVTGLSSDLGNASSQDDVETALSKAIDAVVADPDGTGADAGDDAKADEPKGDDAKADEPKGDEPKGDEPKGDEPADPDAEPAAEAPAEPEDGSIPTHPVSNSDAPADPITRLQTGLDSAIAGAADAAHQGVAGAADAARGITNTSVGFVTTGADGAVRADTLGLSGPQHIDAIRTETSASDYTTTREAAAPAAGPAAASSAASAPATPMAPTAPYGGGAPMMAAPPVNAPAPAPAPGVPANTSPGAPAGRHSAPDTGRHHRLDELTSGGSHQPTATSGTADHVLNAAAAGVAYLTMLRRPIAGAHTRLALLRMQQITSNTVTASAIGVFENGTDTTYVLATAHGLSYIAHDDSLPSDTALLSELVDDAFYGRWCGYVDPAAKLAAYASTAADLGALSYVLTTADGGPLPGIEVETQSLVDVENLATSKLLAPTSRSRRDIVLAKDEDLNAAIRDMAMRTKVLRGDQYLHVLGRASGSLWNHDADRGLYIEPWLRVLTADALRAVDQGSADQAWFAVDEYRRAARQLATQS